MFSHVTLVPNCCGISLKNGTLWVAEICLTVGISITLFSTIYVNELFYHWHISRGTLWGITHIITIILGIIQTVTSGLMCYGAQKEKPRLLLPWIVFFSMQTVLLALLILAFAIWCIISVEPIPIGLVLLLITIIYCYTFRYFILMVYSYYRQLIVCSSENSSHVVQLA